MSMLADTYQSRSFLDSRWSDHHVIALASNLVWNGQSQVRPAGWPGGISPLGFHRTERDSLPSLRSSHPRSGQNSFIQAQWANMPVCLAVSLCHLLGCSTSHSYRFDLNNKVHFGVRFSATRGREQIRPGPHAQTGRSVPT